MALALCALSAVIAMAARAPLSRSTPVDARSAAAPVTALYLLACGAGIIGLSLLGVLLWGGRRRRGDDDEPEPECPEPEIHWLWKLLAIIVPVALGAALVAAVAVGLKSGGHAARPSGRAPGGVAGPLATRPLPATAHGYTVPAWLPWTALGIVLAGLIVGAGLWWWRAREPAAIAGLQATPAEAAVQAAIGALDGVDDPRDAVIAAYAAMQDTLAARGVPRLPAEAPREYLQRVLRATAASEAEAEARTLTGLFEEARFSIHPISGGIRERALSALRAVRTTLGRAATP
ncbi:MAG: DUF4129 domain-containing protein [Solirubrobacteraceae bacterium]